ncbi:MAG: TlpA disulfide reductase family protein [Ginsengibacter sp.]
MSSFTKKDVTVTIHIQKNYYSQPDTALVLVDNDVTTKVVPNANGIFKITIKDIPLEGRYAQLKDMFQYKTFYLEPGKDLNISIGNSMLGSDVYFTGAGADKAQFCNTRDIRKIDDPYNPELYKMNQKSFDNFMSRVFNANKRYIFSKNMDQNFLKKEVERMRYVLFSQYGRYPIQHMVATKSSSDSFKIEKSFSRFIKDSLLRESLPLTYLKEYQETLINLLYSYGMGYDDNLQELEGEMEIITTHFTHPVILELLIHEFVMAYGRKASFEDIPQYVELYKKYVKSPVRLQEFEKLKASWAHLLKGQPAPDFSYKDQNNTTVKLSSLRGRYVLVDIWATWCGACREELPALSRLEEEFKNRNIAFVGLSIDKPDRKSQWINMVKEDGLPGIQVITEGDMSFVDAVNMTIIPRYLLIDPKGRIYDADLPRPSTPMLKEVLNSIKDL